METIDQTTSIQELLSRYDNKVQVFYEKFYALVNSVFSEEIKIYKGKVEVYNQLAKALETL